jgi:hypothetical protein
MRPTREACRLVKQGACGASFYLSRLAAGLPNLAPRPCRQAGPPQPYSWRDSAALRNRPARLRSPAHTCTWSAPLEEFFSILMETRRKRVLLLNRPPEVKEKRRFSLRRGSSSFRIKCLYPERIVSDSVLCHPPCPFSDCGLDPADEQARPPSVRRPARLSLWTQASGGGVEGLAVMRGEGP